MNIPAANVVVTFDVNAMIEFQNTKDLGVFKDYIQKREQQSEYRRETFIFTNSPNSSLISLEHTLEKDNTKLQIKLIDPEGVFEKEILDNKAGSNIDVNNDPFGQRIRELQQEKLLANNELAKLKKQKEEIRYQGNNAAVENLVKNSQQQSKLRDRLSQIETEIKNVNDWDVSDYSNIIKRQLEPYASKMARQVYITYGVGTNLQDWAPPMCFGKITKIDYGFTGEGVKTLTINFVPEAASPNLTAAGIKPLGKDFIKSLTVKGVSEYNLFTAEGGKQASDQFILDYKVPVGEQDKVKRILNTPENPSYHWPIIECLENYIRNATGQKDNVLVLIPDLDVYLQKYIKQVKNNCLYALPTFDYTTGSNRYVAGRASNVDVLTYIKAMEGLGFKVCEINPKVNSNMPTVVGKNVYRYIEECRSAEVVEDWFNRSNFRVMARSDFSQKSFVESLDDIGKTISSKIKEYTVSGTITTGSAERNLLPPPMSFMVEPLMVTDFNLLKSMFDAGLITDMTKPAIVWGDRNLIQKVLYGTLYETVAKNRIYNEEATDPTPASLEDFVTDKLDDWVNPLDQLRGFNAEFTRKVFDYYVPTSWTGPFGKQYNGSEELDAFLPGDTNLQQAAQQLEQDNPLVASRTPLFSFGTKSPNVLSVNFKVDGTYQSVLNQVTPIGKQEFAVAPGIISDNFKDEANRMFDSIADLDLEDIDEETKVPKGFERLLDKFYDYDWPSGDDIQNFDQWQEIFNKLNPTKYKDFTDESFYGDWIGGLTSKQKFVKYMWDAFHELYTYVRPTMERSNDSKTPSNTVLMDSVRVAQKLNQMALTGSIRTVPLFSLSTSRRVSLKSCVLYCVEPRVYLTTNQTDNYSGNATWFSGIYQMTGFSHSIRSGEATSTFYLSRPSNRGLARPKDGELE